MGMQPRWRKGLGLLLGWLWISLSGAHGAPRSRLAFVGVGDRTGKGLPDLALQASHSLEVALQGMPQWEWVAKEEVQRALQATGATLPYDRDELLLIGRQAQAHLVAFGELTALNWTDQPAEVFVSLTLTVMDTRLEGPRAYLVQRASSGKWYDYSGERAPLIAAALERAARQTAQRLAQVLSVEGSVVLRDGDRVLVSLDERAGLQPGMELGVVQGGRLIASLRVEEVQTGRSVARIVSLGPAAEVRPNDKVLLVSPLPEGPSFAAPEAGAPPTPRPAPRPSWRRAEKALVGLLVAGILWWLEIGRRQSSGVGRTFFTVSPTRGAVLQVDNVGNLLTPVVFTWTENPDAQEYVFLLAEDEQFQNLLYAELVNDNKVDFPNAILPFLQPDGTYYWQVWGLVRGTSITGLTGGVGGVGGGAPGAGFIGILQRSGARPTDISYFRVRRATRLEVRSTPAGARIFLDLTTPGTLEDTGRTTPYAFLSLPPRAYQVRLELQGYLPYTSTVNVQAGQTAVVEATLTATP